MRVKIRPKKVVKTAEQWNGKPMLGVCTKYCSIIGGFGGMAHIHTDKGLVRVYLCDWIVTGLEGELYPVSPSVFAKTYEIIPDGNV